MRESKIELPLLAQEICIRVRNHHEVEVHALAPAAGDAPSLGLVIKCINTLSRPTETAFDIEGTEEHGAVSNLRPLVYQTDALTTIPDTVHFKRHFGFSEF